MTSTATIIAELKRRALESTDFRRHKMAPWVCWNPYNYVAVCIQCEAQVKVLSDPKPNQIGIGGEAVALNCPVN